jgi:hypothetical protein
MGQPAMEIIEQMAVRMIAEGFFAATRRGMPVVVFGAVRPTHGSQGWARNLLWQSHLERARAYCLTINA